MRSEQDIRMAMDCHADMVKRISFMHLKNDADVEDVFQKVYLKYALYQGTFKTAEHEKAWFIRVTINCCKDLLKSWFRQRVRSIEEINEISVELKEEQNEVLEAIRNLPEKYRNVIYLFYYEGYSAVEIAKFMNKKENTIYTWLSRAKEELRQQLGGGYSG